MTRIKWWIVLAAVVVPFGVYAAASGITANQILTAAPTTVSVSGVAASEGTALAMARADHVHSLTGTLPVNHGGTGAVTLASHGILVGAGTGAVVGLTACTAGQLVVGQSSADPACETLSSDATLASTGALTLKSVGTAGTTGDATHVAQITTDAQGRVSGASAVLITGTAPGGAAGGDLTGTYPNPTIGAGKVTFAKMQSIATDSLIGRDTAGTGDPENILLNATLSMDGSGNLQRAALSGDITASAGSNATTLADVATGATVTNATVTFNNKGLVTSASSGTAPVTSVSVTAPITTTGGTTPSIGMVNQGATTTVLHGNSSGNPSFGAVVDADLSGTVGVAHGGTALNTLTAHAVYVGNGASAPTALSVGASNTFLKGSTGVDPAFGTATLASADFANQGATTQLLHGNGSGNPTWAAVDVSTAQVTGTMAVGNGGTGLATMGAVGAIPTGGSAGTGAMVALADVAVGSVLKSGGSGVIPAWAATSVPINGAAPQLVLGAVAASSSGQIDFKGLTSGVASLAAQDTAGTNTFKLPSALPASTLPMTMTSGGIMSTGALTVAQGGTGAVTLTGALVGNGTSAVTAGTLTVANGGTGATTFSNTGAIVTAGASGTSAMVALADVATGSVLVSGGANTIPAYTTSPSITAITLSGLTTTGTLAVGAGGTINKLIPCTGTLDFASTNTATCGTDLSYSCTGVAVGDPCALGAIQTNVMGLGGIFFQCWVSGAGTVAFRFCNLSGAARDPTSATYTAFVQH